MNEIDKIRDRLERGYTQSLYGNSEILFEQMEDDISSLLIFYDAVKRSKELIIKDILNWADNIDDCWWLDSPNKGGYNFDKLRGEL
jgi:hypothetical protein